MGCNLKTMNLIECALIGVCAVIRWNMVFAKTTHIFSARNTSELNTVLTRTVNMLTTNEPVKLMML